MRIGILTYVSGDPDPEVIPKGLIYEGCRGFALKGLLLSSALKLGERERHNSGAANPTWSEGL